MPTAALKGGVTALVLSTGFLGGTAPAEAFFFPGQSRGAAITALVGGLALGALAAQAQSTGQGRPGVTWLPDELEDDASRQVRRAPPRKAKVSKPTQVSKAAAKWATLPAASSRAGSAQPASGSIVQACRQTLLASSRPYGGTKASAVSGGPVSRTEQGTDAPINARLEFARQGGTEVREAKLLCRLDGKGRVVTLRDRPSVLGQR
jgi:hypothetical protein